MKKFLLRKSLTIGLFIITAFVIESFLFLYLGLGFLPEYVLFDVALILFFSFIFFCLPIGRFQNIFISIVVFLQIILAYTNICIYQTLNDIFTFDLLSLVKETQRVLTFDMLPIWPFIFYLCLFTLFITSLLLLKKIDVRKFKHDEYVNFVVRIISIIGLTISFGLYSVTSEYLIRKSDDEQLFFFSDVALYNSFSSNKQALTKFGSWGFYFEEFFRQFYTANDTVNYTKAELNAYLSQKEYDPSSLGNFGACKGQNVIMVMLESFEWFAISPELTPTLYALARGYDFGTMADNYQNFNFYEFIKDIESDTFTELKRKDYDYDGHTYTKNEDITLFENDSLFNNYGYTLVNYYSKAKTDYSEASAILGNYPYNESFTTHGGILGYSSQNLYSNINYTFTLPNMLRDSGAVEVTKYMHSYISTFYGRDTLIKQFGFEETKFLDEMSDKIETNESLSHVARDSQIIEYYLNNPSEYDFIPSDKSFFSFYTSVTTHGEYTENPMLEDHYKFIDSVGFYGRSEEGKKNHIGLTKEQESFVRTYLASALDTEYAITLLIKHLMDTGLFDNTTIVLFSDHQSYYDQMDLYYKSAFFSDEEGKYSSPIYWLRDGKYGEEYGINNQDRYKIPAMIYSTRLTDEVVGGDAGHSVTKLTTTFDLTVTVMCLLGVEYNTAFYLGYPVQCQVLNEKTGKYAELGVPVVCSSTGGVFDLQIHTEEGKTLKYNRSYVKMPEDLTMFSYKAIKYVEKWYKITALYQNDMFGRE